MTGVKKLELLEMALHKNWKTTVGVFAIIALFHFFAAYSKFILFNFIGFTLYAVIPLMLVKSTEWPIIRIQKPSRFVPILWGFIGVGGIIGGSYFVLQATVGYSTANFIVLLAKNQISLSNIEPHAIWSYFPLAVMSLCIVSPITEELFFRGLLLQSLELRFSALIANIVQGLLFGFIHLAYCWYVAFDMTLIVTMLPWITLTGILYGWVTQATGSLFAAMMVHVVGNFGLVLVMFAFIIPVLIQG